MGQFDLISGSIAIYLLISGLLMKWLGLRVSASRQHQLAFVTITLLILSIFPQLGLPMVAPGIIFSLGMMLFALHLSAYYSGTPKNSARIYAVILFLSALVLAQLAHPVFQDLAFGRFIMMGVIWLLLLELERIVSTVKYTHSRVERSFLWVWFLSSGLSLVEVQIQILPDLFFLILLLTHMEKRWPRRSIPAPLVALYGILFVWHAHYLVPAIPGQDAFVQAGALIPNLQIALVSILGVGILWYSSRSPSLSKKFLYLFIAQEILVLGLGIENMFAPTQEYIGLLRLLLFIALIGLFVMIESKEGNGLDQELLGGLRIERPRFTLGLMTVASFLALSPLVYPGGDQLISNLLLGVFGLVGLYWVLELYQTSAQKTERNYRILRPSLSIWSTVVFTILWAAVTVLDLLIRHNLS